MNLTLSAAQWLQIAGLGAFFGMIGQLIRAIAGLKKFHESKAASDGGDSISAQRLVTSLAIGAVAGALAALGLGGGLDLEKIQASVILGLMGSGYAGADFIEAFMQKYVPGNAAAGGGSGAGNGGAATTPQAATNPTATGKGQDEQAYG